MTPKNTKTSAGWHALDLNDPELRRLIAREEFVTPKSRRPRSPRSPRRHIEAVVAFHANSLTGSYYDGFNVNSTNYMDSSEGTSRWIRQVNRMLDICVALASSTPAGAGELVQAFERILDLLIRIDSGEDFISFADEAGSWQVGVDEAVVLPAYFTCLAASEDAEVFATKVITLIQALAEHKAEKLRRAAHKVATPAQRRALTMAWRAKPRSWEAGRLFRQACGQAGK